MTILILLEIQCFFAPFMRHSCYRNHYEHLFYRSRIFNVFFERISKNFPQVNFLKITLCWYPLELHKPSFDWWIFNSSGQKAYKGSIIPFIYTYINADNNNSQSSLGCITRITCYSIISIFLPLPLSGLRNFGHTHSPRWLQLSGQH